MVTAKNVSPHNTLEIKGVLLGPGESGELNCDKSDVKDHLFVRSGLIQIEAQSGRPPKSASRRSASDAQSVGTSGNASSGGDAA